MRNRGASPLHPNSVAGRAAHEKQAVHIHDIASENNYPVQSISLGKVRTGLGVPLLREGDSIGVIALARQRVEPFTHRQIELVRTFADQAVIAIENARLLGELRQRTEEVGELNRDLEARAGRQIEQRDVGGGQMELAIGVGRELGLYRGLVSEVTCVDWPSSLHGSNHLDHEMDLNQPLALPDAAYDTVILSDVL